MNISCKPYTVQYATSPYIIDEVFIILAHHPPLSLRYHSKIEVRQSTVTIVNNSPLRVVGEDDDLETTAEERAMEDVLL